MSRMGSERAGVELEVVGGVVAVDVGFFENVGFGAKYPEMADGVLHDVRMAVAEHVNEAVPGSGGAERSDAVGDSHCGEGIRSDGSAEGLRANSAPGELLTLLRSLDGLLLDPIEFGERLLADRERDADRARGDRGPIRGADDWLSGFGTAGSFFVGHC